MKSSLKSFLFFIGLFFSSPSWATVEDSQIWTSVTASAEVAPKFDVAVELHARFMEDSSKMGQKIIRPSLIYKLNNHLSFSGGYFYGLSNSSTSPETYEQRLWQQMGYILMHTDADLILSGRTRLEERFVEDNNDTGYRLRQQFRLQAPLMERTSLKGVLWNETFFSLNETSWGQKNDIDQTRTFIGISLPLSDQTSIEPGYLNQIVFNDTENRQNHVASIGLNLKF